MTTQDEAERLWRDRVERRAYEMYKARGEQHGLDEEDWEKAERELEGLDSDDSLPQREEEYGDGQT